MFAVTSIAAIFLTSKLISVITSIQSKSFSFLIYFSFVEAIYSFLFILNIGFSQTIISVINTSIILLTVIFLKKRRIKSFGAFFVSSRRKILKITISLGLGVILLTGIILFRNGIPADIIFLSSDSAHHFMQSKALANGGSGSTQFASWFIDASFISVFQSIFSDSFLFTGYLISETLIFLIGAGIFYATLSAANIESGPLKIAFTLLYMCGFPLSVYMFGFSYLYYSVVIVNAILFTFISYRSLNNQKTLIFFLALLNFSLIISYSLFVPGVFIGVGLALLVNLHKSDVGLHKILLYEACAFTLSLFIGYVLVYSQIFSSELSVKDAISSQGGSLFVSYSSFIFILPLALYGFASLKKRGNYLSVKILCLSILLYSLVLFVCSVYNIVSAYYFSKILPLVWLIMFVYGALGTAELVLCNKKMFASYSCTWLLILSSSLSNLDSTFNQKRPFLNPQPVADSLFYVYHFNLVNLREGKMDLNFAAIDSLIKENVSNPDEKIPMLFDEWRGRWYYAMNDNLFDLYHWGMSSNEISDELKLHNYLLVDIKRPLLQTKDKVDIDDLLNSMSDEYELVSENNEAKLLKRK